MNNTKIIKTEDDGIGLIISKHKFWPGKKWYQKIYLYFKYSFRKPKFSKDALEEVEIIRYYDNKLDNFGIKNK